MKDEQINEAVDRDADICAKYSYWQKINRLIVACVLPLILSIPFVAIFSYCPDDGIKGVIEFWCLIMRESWPFLCILLLGYLSPIIASFKLPKFLRFLLAGLSALVLCVWLWCLVLSLTDPELRWMTDVVLVLGLISLIPCFFAILISLYSKFAEWRFCRSEIAVQEKKLKRLQNALAKKIDSFLSQHQVIPFSDSKNFIFCSMGLIAIVIAFFAALFTLYFYVGGIDFDSRPIPKIDDLNLQICDVPDDDNAYISLVSLTNKCTVARSEGGDTHNEDERLFIRDFTECDPSLLTDEEETKKWYSIQNDTNSLNLARKIISDNEEFFKAFPNAVTKNQFSVRAEILKNNWKWHPHHFYLPEYNMLIDYARLFSLRAKLALENNNVESALADIVTIYNLGEKISTKFSPDGFSSVSMEFLIGRLIMDVSFNQFQYAVATDKATDQMLIKCDEIVDKAESSILDVREMLIKMWFSHIYKSVDWYASRNFLDLEYTSTDQYLSNSNKMSKTEWLKGLSFNERLKRMLFYWPGHSTFLFNREETLQKLVECTRTTILKKRVEITEENQEVQSWLTIVMSRNGLGKVLISSEKCGLEFLLNELNKTLYSVYKMKLLIAAAKWRKAHGGKTPPSLEALIPEYLPNVPIDPFDKNGGPLKYDGKLGVVWCCGKRGDYDYYDAVKQLDLATGKKKADLRSTIHENSFRIDALPILQLMR